MTSRIEIYEKRIEALERQKEMAIKRGKRLMWMRLLSFAAAVAALFGLFAISVVAAVGLSLLLMGLFALVATRDVKNQRLVAYYDSLIAICRNEVACINGDTSAFDTGAIYFDIKHAYTYDLDIFGDRSIFQLLCRASTAKGKQLLAQRLQHPLKREEIARNQQSVDELANEMEWRQELQAVATKMEADKENLTSIKTWLTADNDGLSSFGLRLMVVGYPILVVGLMVLWGVGILNGLVTLSLFPYFIIYGKYGNRIAVVQSLVGKSADELRSYAHLLKVVEAKTFSSPQLMELKRRITKSGRQPSAITAEFAQLVQQLDVRNNAAFMLLVGAYIFWDFRVVFKLNRWKRKYQLLIDEWVAVVGEMEVLASLATLAYNNPSWTMPEVAEGYFRLEATEAGHPLIPAKQRVCNSFSITDSKTILLTGSNMAGKSTFLRTLGVNMVLAYAGAPVCAQRLTVSYVPIRTSMRITDSLVENTSSFYAEIKRLGEIVKAVKEGEKAFLLLDEILRGTNSNDRHIGSKALVDLLVENQVCGIIATHDLSLSEAQHTYPKAIANYHFDVQVDEKDELYFDYKVKTGVCTSLNASILMRKIGLKV
jgi:ABC-type multidrug transport system fused ATPase/permease subunit